MRKRYDFKDIYIELSNEIKRFRTNVKTVARIVVGEMKFISLPPTCQRALLVSYV